MEPFSYPKTFIARLFCFSTFSTSLREAGHLMSVKKIKQNKKKNSKAQKKIEEMKNKKIWTKCKMIV